MSAAKSKMDPIEFSKRVKDGMARAKAEKALREAAAEQVEEEDKKLWAAEDDAVALLRDVTAVYLTAVRAGNVELAKVLWRNVVDAHTVWRIEAEKLEKCREKA